MVVLVPERMLLDVLEVGLEVIDHLNRDGPGEPAEGTLGLAAGEARELVFQERQDARALAEAKMTGGGHHQWVNRPAALHDAADPVWIPRPRLSRVALE